jgi:hypothetical protein
VVSAESERLIKILTKTSTDTYIIINTPHALTIDHQRGQAISHSYKSYSKIDLEADHGKFLSDEEEGGVEGEDGIDEAHEARELHPVTSVSGGERRPHGGADEHEHTANLQPTRSPQQALVTLPHIFISHA